MPRRSAVLSPPSATPDPPDADEVAAVGAARDLVLENPLGLVGRTEARLWTRPLRPLTRKTTRGYEVIDFARDVLREPLTPWEAWFAIHSLELNPDGTYRFRVVLLLVARQNGKTHIGRVIALWKLYVDGAQLVLGVGQDLSLAREKMQGCVDIIAEVPELSAEFDVQRRANGDEYFRLVSSARYKIKAANRQAGRGLSVDHLDFEELREQRDWAAWSALSKTTNARPRAQIFGYSNAGDEESIVLNHLRAAALAGGDPSLGIFEWSAPDGCALDDSDAIAQANPGLGYTISEAAIRSARGTDPPAVYRTEVLCQKVDSLDSAIDLDAWRDCRDSAGNLESVRDRVVACIDVAPDGAHVTLAAAAVLDDGRIRVETVAAWTSTDKARFELAGVLERVNPRAVAWYPSGPAAALAPLLRPTEEVRSDGSKVKGRPVRSWANVELRGGLTAEACQGFADLVAARQIVQPGDPLMDAHAAGAQRLHQGDGWRFVRRGAGHVDAMYAAAGAVQTALTLPVEKPLQKMWVV